MRREATVRPIEVSEDEAVALVAILDVIPLVAPVPDGLVRVAAALVEDVEAAGRVDEIAQQARQIRANVWRMFAEQVQIVMESGGMDGG
jgi:hypothetical protein